MSNHQRITSDAAAAEFMPASVAYYNQVVPLRFIADTLLIGAASPLTTQTQELLQFVLNQKIRGVVRSAAYVAARLAQLYGRRADDDGASDEVTWYWPDWHFCDDEKLVIKCSGRKDGIHWSGCHEFPPDHPDHEMWRWIVSVRQYRRLVNERELKGLRRIWKRYVARCHPT